MEVLRDKSNFDCLLDATLQHSKVRTLSQQGLTTLCPQVLGHIKLVVQRSVQA